MASDDHLFDPFAPTAAASAPKTPQKVWNPFENAKRESKLIQIESPDLNQRLNRSSGVFELPASKTRPVQPLLFSLAEDDDLEPPQSKQSRKTKSSKGKGKQSRRTRGSSSAPTATSLATEKTAKDSDQQSADEALETFYTSQCAFVSQLATHPLILKLDLQKKAIRAGAESACISIIHKTAEVPDDAHLLLSLGLLKRLKATEKRLQADEKAKEKLDLPIDVLERLVVLADGGELVDARIRAFAISLLAAVSDKTVLESLGFFDVCLSLLGTPHLSAAETETVDSQSEDEKEATTATLKGDLKESEASQLVENALAIAITNFSLDVERQLPILETGNMLRFAEWAKSGEADLQTCAAAFVGNMVANPACQNAVLHGGGISILEALASSPKAVAAAQVHAVRGLANLALHKTAHSTMMSRGILERLGSIIASGESEAAAEAASSDDNKSGKGKSKKKSTTMPSTVSERMRQACRCISYLAASTEPLIAVAVSTALNNDQATTNSIKLWAEHSPLPPLQSAASVCHTALLAASSRASKATPGELRAAAGVIGPLDPDTVTMSAQIGTSTAADRRRLDKRLHEAPTEDVDATLSLAPAVASPASASRSSARELIGSSTTKQSKGKTRKGQKQTSGFTKKLTNLKKFGGN